ncbi:MAG: hypothetical protein AB1625_11835 [Acidobacteriota bacterium]
MAGDLAALARALVLTLATAGAATWANCQETRTPTPTPTPTAAPAAPPTPAPKTPEHGAGTQADGQATPASTPTPTPAGAPETAPAAAEGECAAAGEEARRLAWISRLRSWAHRTVAGSAAWFDGLFGDVRADDDVYVSRARLTTYVTWDQEDGVSPAQRLRARYVFPQMERKLGILLGRGDVDDLVSATDPAGGGLDHLAESENETVAGLEYAPTQGKGSRLSFSAGARIADPIDPYARVRFRRLVPIGDDALFRFRQTVFWRETQGFGTTTSFDIERRREGGFLLRLSLSGTISEVTDGVDVGSELTAYRWLDERSAIACHAWAAGETQAPVPTSEYGVDLAYRRRLRWPWLIGELSAGHAWRREVVADPRHGVWLAGVGVEMQLGSTP